MKQEETDLLLKDLCARLPYSVKCYVANETNSIYILLGIANKSAMVISDNKHTMSSSVENIKPYLFPLSNMTNEQKEEFYKFFEEGITESANETRQWLRTKRADETRRPITIAYVTVHELVINWLNKNHFDYRGLIPKGLAIDATGLNIY